MDTEIQRLKHKYVGDDAMGDMFVEELQDLLSSKEKELKAWRDIAEGLILRPKVNLRTRRGDRLITKIKHRDFK